MDYTAYYQEPVQKPYALYLHGMGSGAQGGTKSSLGHYLDQYEWLAPEITHNPYESLDIINEWVKTFQPALIAGTSMGGMMTLYVDCPQAIKLAVNPSMSIEKVLRRFGYGKHPYSCEREDGATEYEIDEEMVRRYIQFRKEMPIVLGTTNLAVFSQNDEVTGHQSSLESASIIEKAGFAIRWSDKFGHRMNERCAKQIAAWLKAGIE